MSPLLRPLETLLRDLREAKVQGPDARNIKQVLNHVAERLEEAMVGLCDLLETGQAMRDACFVADAHEELSEFIDGSLLDKWDAALAKVKGKSV